MGGIFTSMFLNGYNKIITLGKRRQPHGIPENERVKKKMFTNINHRKRGLVIGINYTPSSQQKDHLNGCVKDMSNLKMFLKQKCFFSRWQLTSLENGQATRDRIIAELLKLVSYSYDQPGAELWFSYSGHGSSKHSFFRWNNISDVICPYDCDKNGIIDDEWLHNHFIHALHPKTKLFILMDCCNAGSNLKLPFCFNAGGKKNMCSEGSKDGYHSGYDGDDDEVGNISDGNDVSQTDDDNRCEMLDYKYNYDPENICSIVKLSGSRDNQTCSEYFDFSFNEYQGALTNAFLELDQYNKLCDGLDYITDKLVITHFTHHPVLTYSHKWGCDISLL